jgi:hypothetical protein
VGEYVKPVVTGILVLGGVVAVALLGPALERRGLPGILFAVAVLGVLLVWSIRAVLGELPPRGRRRMLAETARAHGWRMKIRPRLPRSVVELPSFSDPRRIGIDVWNLIAIPGTPVILTFDRRVRSEDAYEAPTWVGSALCRVEVDVPRLIVEPRPPVTADPLGPLTVRTSELGEFERRYRIRTGDSLFSTALLDQRMLAWLLEQPSGWTFEVGGRWAMVSTNSLADPEELVTAVALVRTFCARIPTVVPSMRSSRI